MSEGAGVPGGVLGRVEGTFKEKVKIHSAIKQREPWVWIAAGWAGSRLKGKCSGSVMGVGARLQGAGMLRTPQAETDLMEGHGASLHCTLYLHSIFTFSDHCSKKHI